MITFNEDYSAIIVTFCFLQLHCNCSDSGVRLRAYIDARVTNCLQDGNIIQGVCAYLESSMAWCTGEIKTILAFGSSQSAAVVGLC